MISFLFLLVFLSGERVFAKTVRYELNVTQETFNLSGKKSVDFALAVNGGIPAPTLYFTEGDEAEIQVNNKVPGQEVSIHWHGLLVPPEEDGVPYVTTPPIRSGQSRTFRFKIRQHGTYWYHSHTGLQEQKGIFGAFVIQPRKKTVSVDRDVVALFSDWTDEHPDQVLRNLKKDGDFYLFKKNTIRSYWGALLTGTLGPMLKNEWQRMGGMDLSDVGYDAFLLNGKKQSQLLEAEPGEKVRIRVINGSASTYFRLSLGQAPFQVISADGMDIEPRRTREVLMGMAETYDILFTVPDSRNFELRATAQDGSGFASGWIGKGAKVFAPDVEAPDLYGSMNHGVHKHAPAEREQAKGHEGHSAQGGHGNDLRADASDNLSSLTVDQLRSPVPTAFPKTGPSHEVKLVLGGDMERYVWYINGKAIHQERNILINEGDLVRFTLVNETMMHHPMHFHGHFFRVVNSNGDHSPLKHTVDVPPHGTRSIEFIANEPGEWMLHCHNLYHMKTGMARVVKYSSFSPSSEMQVHQKHDPHLHDHLYGKGQFTAATNLGRFQASVFRTWDALELDVEAKDEDKKWRWEGDFFYRRWLGPFFSLVGGGTSFRDQQRGTIGFTYKLPLLIEATALVDHKGKLRLGIERRFQWTGRIFSEGHFSIRQNYRPEWNLSLMYGSSWYWAAGLLLTDEKLGVGGRVRF